MPDALSKRLRDPDLLLMVQATGEGVRDHLANALQIAAGMRDRLDDVDPELALDFVALERRILLALVVDARTPKMQMVAEPYATGPQLVRDTMATFDDGDPDGA